MLSKQDNEFGFRYEGGTDTNPETCIFTHEGKEYRVPYKLILQWANSRRKMPRVVLERIDFWVEMIINPD